MVVSQAGWWTDSWVSLSAFWRISHEHFSMETAKSLRCWEQICQINCDVANIRVVWLIGCFRCLLRANSWHATTTTTCPVESQSWRRLSVLSPGFQEKKKIQAWRSHVIPRWNVCSLVHSLTAVYGSTPDLHLDFFCCKLSFYAFYAWRYIVSEIDKQPQSHSLAFKM